MNVPGLSKEDALRRILPKVMDSEAMQTLTGVLAKSEYSVVARAAALDDALDAGVIDEEPSVEDRQEELQGLLQALITETVDEWWIENVAPDTYDNADRLDSYLSIDADEWREQIETKAERYRQRGASGSDAALMEHHVKQTFGVTLGRFEREIVGWDRGEAATEVFAGDLEDVATLLDVVLREHGVEPPEIDHEA